MFVYQLVLWDRDRFELDDEDDDDDDDDDDVRDDVEDAERMPTTPLNDDDMPGTPDSDVEATLAEMYAGADSESTSCADHRVEIAEIIDDLHDDDYA